ncbi:MAG: lysophospholipid acyltransferase family protein [Sphingomicrobium sp.]
MRVAALLAWLMIAAPLHLLTKGMTGRSDWPRRFLAVAADLIGAQVRVSGAPLRPHSLLIANHVSWLDILALGGATGTVFVSKDQLGPGFVHWLADQNRTIYVRREDRRDSKAQAVAIATALESEQAVALFPEGTVGPGDALLPFRSTLVEAATYAGKDVEIRPVALDYGPDASAIAWFGEPALTNARRVLGRWQPVDIHIRLLEPLSDDGGRKVIAARARAAITDALGFADASPSPIGAGK